MENTAIEKEVKKDKKIRQNSSTEEIKKQIVIALIPMILNFVLNYAIVDTYFLFFMHISTFLLSIFISTHASRCVLIFVCLTFFML